MKLNSGEMIKKIRKDMGLGREEFAKQLHISTRQMARIVAGEVDLGIWQFMSMMELETFL